MMYFLLLGGCLRQAPSPQWISPMEQEHPLVGKWWDVSGKKEVSFSHVVKQLQPAQVVLLGEKHDNADHHQLQAKLLAALIDDKTDAVIAFEMLNDPDKLTGTWESPSAFAEAVGWNRSGWPEFSIYQPIIEVALDKKAMIVAANPSPEMLMETMKGGWQTIPPDELAVLGLDLPLSDSGLADLKQEIIDGHCGHASGKMVDMMIIAQRLKDAWMAQQMAKTGKSKQFLIAGNGHVRRDRGVGFYLPKDKALSVAAIEVSQQQTDPTKYSDLGVDFIFFTPRVDNVDPCEKFREQLKKMKHK